MYVAQNVGIIARFAWRRQLPAQRNTALAVTNAGKASSCKSPRESAQVSRNIMRYNDSW